MPLGARSALHPTGHGASSAALLAAVFATLVLYASLYPFEGWRWPPGQELLALLALPGSDYKHTFDVASNLLGYAPLGLLLALGLRRSGWGWRQALGATVLGTSGLSYGCEVLQQFIPGRVPALEDWLMNTAGATSGALLALALQTTGWVDRWQAFRQRWFAGDAAFALVLLALWPVGLLFPTPVPLGLGQVAERLRETGADWLANVQWAATLHQLLATPAPMATPLRPLVEALIVALGLLAPCVVAFSVTAPGWRRLALTAGALATALAAMTLSTWLNFGPHHAMAWLTPSTALGLGVGSAAAAVATLLSRRLIAGLGLVVLTGLVTGMAQAPDDPYFAQSLLAWEQGRFVRFHGLAQWVGWLWPYAAVVWLLSRLARPRF
jgi:VanZ family protein